MATEKRLIWADALNEVIEKTDWYSVSNGKLTHGATTFTGLFKATDIFDAIENAPTMDAVEVVHGQWISDEGDVLFHCSECETQISTSWDYDDLQWNYCPNCGAKMDGDGNG